MGSYNQTVPFPVVMQRLLVKYDPKLTIFDLVGVDFNMAHLYEKYTVHIVFVKIKPTGLKNIIKKVFPMRHVHVLFAYVI